MVTLILFHGKIVNRYIYSFLLRRKRSVVDTIFILKIVEENRSEDDRGRTRKGSEKLFSHPWKEVKMLTISQEKETLTFLSNRK